MIEKELGWQPKYSLREGITKLYECIEPQVSVQKAKHYRDLDYQDALTRSMKKFFYTKAQKFASDFVNETYDSIGRVN